MQYQNKLDRALIGSDDAASAVRNGHTDKLYAMKRVGHDMAGLTAECLNEAVISKNEDTVRFVVEELLTGEYDEIQAIDSSFGEWKYKQSVGTAVMLDLPEIFIYLHSVFDYKNEMTYLLIAAEQQKRRCFAVMLHNFSMVCTSAEMDSVYSKACKLGDLGEIIMEELELEEEPCDEY